jgi:predicted O-methyltransferase YrrM
MKEMILSIISQKFKYNAIANKGVGEISIKEGRFLGNLVSNIETIGPIVEIGKHFGFSTIIMCLFKEEGRKLITVDNYSRNSVGLKTQSHMDETKY